MLSCFGDFDVCLLALDCCVGLCLLGRFCWCLIWCLLVRLWLVGFTVWVFGLIWLAFIRLVFICYVLMFAALTWLASGLWFAV